MSLRLCIEELFVIANVWKQPTFIEYYEYIEFHAATKINEIVLIGLKLIWTHLHDIRLNDKKQDAELCVNYVTILVTRKRKANTLTYIVIYT